MQIHLRVQRPSHQPINYYSNSYGAPVAAHRGVLILGLGIAAIVCNMFFVPGILAWILGRADLKEIRAGRMDRMDRMGESTTQAGMIMGIVMTCIPILVIGAYIAFVIFLLIVGLLAAAAGA